MLITLTACKGKELRCVFNYVWTAAVLLLTGVAAICGEAQIFGIYKWTLVTALLNVWLIGVLAYRTARRVFVEKTLKIRLNVISILWIIMTVLMTLSPFHAVWPLWFFCIFGLFYLTEFTERDFADLREGMIDGIILGFFLLQIYAYGYRPYDEVRYKGAFANCIMAAMHYSVTYMAVLFKLHLLVQRGGSKLWKAFYFIGAAGLLGFQLLTMTRTAWVATAVITVLYAGFVIKKQWKKTWGRILGYAAALGAAAVLLFPVVYATVRWLPPLRHHPIWYEGEWSESKVQSSDAPISEKYISFEEVLQQLFGRVGITISWKDPFAMEVQAADSTEETTEYRTISIGDVGSGASESMLIRLAYYKAYLEDLNWIGHDDTEGHYYVEETGAFVWHAQNVWIQFLYYFGIPAGCLFIALTVLVLIRQLRNGMRSPVGFIPLFITVAYVVFGLTEVVWLAGQFLLFAVFWVQHPQYGTVQSHANFSSDSH